MAAAPILQQKNVEEAGAAGVRTVVGIVIVIATGIVIVTAVPTRIKSSPEHLMICVGITVRRTHGEGFSS